MLSSVWGIIFPLVVGASPPNPPADLKPWVQYAQGLNDAGPACPPNRPCVQLQRVELSGRVAAGKVTLLYMGENLGRLDQVSPLVAPARAFSVTAAHFRAGKGSVRLADDAWVASFKPGRFQLEIDLRFEPAASVPLQLPPSITHVIDSLEQGALAFDESSERHGGVVFLTTEKLRRDTQELSVRVARDFKYGSVVTFTYHFTVSGLREQARVELPRLGGETFETLDPDIAYTATPTSLVVTLTPGASALQVSGHFASAPNDLQKPATLPFEYWLLEVDPRHPVQLESSGVEIDPAEVPEVKPGARSRAFFLTQTQKLTITPLQVSLDKGRTGAGTANITYSQGRGDFWVGSLLITSTTAPEADRITIPTPAPPHYAESAGEAVRMFADKGTLSLRVVTAEDRLQPIRVQWREEIPTNVFLSMPTLRLPGQGLHLDDLSANVRLLPGHVPIAVFGVQHASGDLIDGLHIYAVLIALLGIALCRAARFPHWATAVTAVLLAGLYTVEGFPRVSLLVLLAGCAALTRLPETALTSLRPHRFVHGLLSLVWLTVVLVTLIPSAVYVKDRIYSALHPWSYGETWQPGVVLGGRLEAMQAVASAPPDMKDQMLLQAQGQGFSKLSSPLGSLNARQEENERYAKLIPKATEKTIRPVAFDTPALPSWALDLSFGSLLPGDEAKARVLLAGPLLRGIWMFAECAGLGSLLVLLLARARRFWRPA